MGVREWLEQLGLEQYVGAFERNDVDPSMLPELCEEDLDRLGISSVGHRKRLLAAIRELAIEHRGEKLDALPSVVAVPLAEYLSEANPVLRLWHACDTIELTLRLVVIAGLAEHGLARRIDPELIRRVGPNIDEPTLGKWKVMAQVVTTWPSANGRLVARMGALVSEVLVPLLDGPGAAAGTPESSFSSLRNQLAHGGGVTRAAARRLLQVWEPRLEDVFRKVTALLSELTIVVRSAGRPAILAGNSAAPRPWQPPPELGPAIEAAFVRGDEVVLVAGPEVLRLWPLAQFGPVGGEHDEVDGPSSPQVYQRRGDVRLLFTPIGNEWSITAEGDATELEAFLSLFRVAARGAGPEYRVRDFDEDIARDSERLIGRVDELAAIRRAVESSPGGVLWVTGPAGSGKSFLVARIAEELGATTSSDERIVLAYRFKAGDDRCSRDRFLQFAIERIEPLVANALAPRPGTPPAERLRILLESTAPGRIVLVLDGLDELAEADPRFVFDVPLAVRRPGLVWLCAGRSERGLEALKAPAVEPVFPDGLPPMSNGDIRTLLLEKIGLLRRRLLLNDRDEGDAVTNPFVERVSEHARGLPIYVRYVIGDILAGRFRALDAGERLPPSLDRYHEELLRRCSVGALHQVITPLVAHLAVAREALSAGALGELLVGAGALTEEDERQGIVVEALAAVSSLLRRASTPEREDGFTLFHHSLRQHMESSAQTRGVLSLARRNLALQAPSAAAHPRAARYLFRWGVSHLVEVGDRRSAGDLLGNAGYLVSRLDHLGTEGVLGITTDWQRLRSSGEFRPQDDAAEAFWRGTEHLALWGDARWPAGRIVHQLASFEPRSSPLLASVITSDGASPPAWPRFELDEADRAPRARRDGCLAVLAGHFDTVNACAFSADGSVAVSGSGKRFDDFTVRVWDVGTHECTRVLRGHDGPIRSVAVTPDARWVASGSADGTVRVWDTRSGECASILSAGSEEVRGVRISPDAGTVLSAGLDGKLRRWNRESRLAIELDLGCEVLCLDADPDLRLCAAGLRDGRVLVVDAGTFRPRRSIAAHSDAVLAVSVSHDATLVASGGRDGRGQVSDVHDSARISSWTQEPDAITAIALTPDGASVLTGCSEGGVFEDVRDKSVRMIRTADGSTVRAFGGHCDFLFALAVTRDGTRAMSGGGDYTLRVWDLNVEVDPEPGSELRWVGDLGVLPGGAYGLSVSDDGALRKWELATRRCVETARSTIEPRPFPLGALSLSAEGDAAALASEDGRVYVWSRADPTRLRYLEGHSEQVNAVSMSADGAWVLSGAGRTGGTSRSGNLYGRREVVAQDTDLRLWHVPSGRTVTRLRGHEDVVVSVAYGPDGSCAASASHDGTVRVWELAAGGQRTFELRGPLLRVVTWSPDGASLVVGDDAGNVRALCPRTGEVRREYAGARCDVRALRFSRDGEILLAVGDDQGVHVWSARTGELLSAAYFETWVTAAAFVGTTHRVWVGLGNGRLFQVALRGVPEPGASIVTPYVAADSGGHLIVVCPACGARVDAEEGGGLRGACSRCGHRLLFTPFVAEYGYLMP